MTMLSAKDTAPLGECVTVQLGFGPNAGSPQLALTREEVVNSANRNNSAQLYVAPYRRMSDE
jgi:hypothetical protein